MQCDVLKTLDGFAKRCTGIFGNFYHMCGYNILHNTETSNTAELSKVLGVIHVEDMVTSECILQP